MPARQRSAMSGTAAAASVEEESVKVVLLGDTGVGKSSLVLRFVNDEFKPYTESTIGASFMSRTLEITAAELEERENEEEEDGNGADERMVEQLNRKRGTAPSSSGLPSRPRPAPRCVAFKIWDTAGQEKYRSLASMYYRGASAAVLVYDICNRGTFDTLRHWADELESKGPPGIVLIVCGNKVDLSDVRQVDEDEARGYAEDIGAAYVETSARDSTNVGRVFVEIGRRVPRRGAPVGRTIEGSVKVDLGYVEENDRAGGGGCYC